MDSDNTIIDYPEQSNQIWKYIFKVWAAATFIPGVFLVLVVPFFGVLTIGGGFAALPTLLPIYILIKLMYRYKIKTEFIMVAICLAFMCSVTLAVLIMEFVMDLLPLNLFGVLFATPVFICGLIAVVVFKLPEIPVLENNNEQ
jgi:hypothetical protein